MAYFFCKFITPRKDFLKTMSADEAADRIVEELLKRR